MRKQILTLLTLAFTMLAGAQHPAVNTLTSTTKLKHANISLMVRDITNNTVVAEYRPEALTPPASVMKTITTATALEIFGPNYLYKTRIETDGEINASGVLNGNIYIVGCGDPTMGSKYLGNGAFLRLWCDKIAEKGIKKINGRVIADISRFDIENINPFWLWEDIGNYYAPGVFAIAYCDNSMAIHLRTQGNGKPVIIESIAPEIDSLSFVNNITCNASLPTTSIYVRGLPLVNTRVLTGNVSDLKETFSVSGDLPNPALLLASDFTKALRERNIGITGKPTYTQTADTAKHQLLFIHASPSLAEIAKLTNFKSNNMYAEHIFRLIGSRGVDISTQANAAGTIINYWKGKVPSMQWNNICDGSGLSPVDRVSAASIVDMLVYMTNSNKYEAFFNSLPLAGKDGTVRNFLSQTPLTKRVRCKSGTTSRIKSYAGYADGPSGHKYAFAVIIADPDCKTNAVTKYIEQLLVSTCK